MKKKSSSRPTYSVEFREAAVAKLYKFLIILAFATLPSNALSSNFDEIDVERVTHISSFLSPKEIVKFSRTSKRFQFLRDRSDTGIFLRNESKFAVTTADGKKYFLEEYLYKTEGLELSELKNIDLLLLERPEYFLKLFEKSAPNTPKDIETSLDSYYNKIFRIDKLMDSLPTYDSPEKNLAAIFLEIAIWNEMKTMVRTQVWDQFEDEIQDSIEEDLAEELDEQLNHLLGMEALRQLGGQIEPQVWELIEDHNFDDDLTEVLKDLKFSSVFQSGGFKGSLKPTIYYFFMTYQIKSLAMRHSIKFKYIQKMFALFIREKMTKEQINESLNILILNTPKGNFLSETQQKIIRRYLPSSLPQKQS